MQFPSLKSSTGRTGFPTSGAPAQKSAQGITPLTPSNGPISTGKGNNNFEVCRVAIDEISTDGRRRMLNQEKVDGLAESMQEIGVKTPITVRKVSGKWRLVVGLHRLHAAKKLGHTHIDCYVLEGDETDARLWELAENLFRADLTVLERAEYLKEWVRLINEKKSKGGQVAQPGGRQPKDKGVSDAARQLNITREEVRRAEKIANISDEAKDEARRAGLDNNQSALIAIADEAPNNQVAKADKLGTHKRKRRRKRIAAADGAEAADVDVIGAPGASRTASAPPKDVLTFAAVLERWRTTKVTASDEAAFARFKASWQPACAAVPDLQAACTDAPESVRVRILAEVWGWRIDDQQAAAPQGPATASDQPAPAAE
jgi:ParB family chromosome partitioning protein